MARLRDAWPVSVAAVTLALIGCAGDGGGPAPEQSEVAEEIVVSAEEVPRIAERFGSGLEVVRWSVDDADGRVGDALAEFADRWAVRGAVREAWEDAGFRLLRVREDELFDVMEALPPVQSLEREWWGTRIQWRSLGATMGTYGRVWADGERIELDGDAARLLMRTWVSPSVGGAAVRVDLCIARSAARKQAFYTETPDLRALDEGNGAEVIGRLRAELALIDGEVVLITAERPGVVWRSPETRVVEGEEFVERGGGRREAPSTYGPGAVRLGSIGEVLLMHEDDRMGSQRDMIVLLARAPEEFRMGSPR